MSLLLLFNQPAQSNTGHADCSSVVSACSGTASSGAFVSLGGGKSKRRRKPKPIAPLELPPRIAAGVCTAPMAEASGYATSIWMDSEEEELAVLAA